MKHAKKLASLLLALVMVLSMSVTAFAASGTNGNSGKITIDNAVVDQTYTIYQILALESYNTDSNAYSYKATTGWEAFVAQNGIKDVYLKTDTQGYVTWVGDKTADRVSDFVALAKAYAVNQTATDSKKATSTTVEFTGLNLGYYLVDSTLGTLCSLDTTNPSVTIKEKNEEPTNAKTVEEDSTDSYGEKNDADIGQTVNFKSAITAQAGAQNYVFHDKMSNGLTFGSVTGITLDGTAVATDNYEVKTSELGDDCTFHVVFTQAFCDTLKANDKIVISYTATVNENAVVAGEGNKNESWLKYGENNDLTTTPSETKTYTWDVDVFKCTMDGETEKTLAGAKFTLSKNANGTNPIALVAGGNNVYRVAKTGETGTVTEIETDATGKFTIKGLDADTYYLTETVAPAGYNKLAAPITIVIDSEGNTKVNNTVVNEVKVLNQSGSELPSTGGIGTTLFYIVGGILMVGAAVLLITKRRMDNED